MSVLLFDFFKHLVLRKTCILKTCRKKKFLGKKIWRNALALKSKKVQGIFRKMFILKMSFVYKTVSHIFLKLFYLGEKRLLSEFLRKWGWFQGHNEHFPKYLGSKLKFQKLRNGFVDERALKTTTVISSCHWKTLVPFCLQKEKTWKHIFSTNSELSQNCSEKQIKLFKTTVNCLLNDIWSYLEKLAFFNK